MITITVTFRCC